MCNTRSKVAAKTCTSKDEIMLTDDELAVQEAAVQKEAKAASKLNDDIKKSPGQEIPDVILVASLNKDLNPLKDSKRKPGRK